MRSPARLAGLALPVFLVLACVAGEIEAPPTSTPSLYRGPVASPTGARPGMPAPEVSATVSGRLPSAPAAPTAMPSEPGAFTLDRALQLAIESLLGEETEHYGIFVKHLDTRRGAAINPDKVFNAASIFKLEVMFEVFRQRDLELLKFDELMEVNEYYAGFDLGTLRLEVGQSMNIAEALFYMMSISDNTAAVLLQDRAGAGNINNTMAKLGLKVSGLFTEGLPATAEDFGVLIEAIARSAEVDEVSRAQMLELMMAETVDNGLKAGVPRGTRVAHKTGNWSDAINDVGIVFAPSGPYLIAVLTDRQNDPAGIRALSTLVFEHFEKTATR